MTEYLRITINIANFNKKTPKITYYCMPNMKQVVIAHNRTILKNQKYNKQMCDLRKQEYIVDGK